MRSLSTRAGPIWLAVLVPAAGCGDPAVGLPDAGTPDAAVSAACVEATGHDDLAWIQSEILTPSCANLAVCHRSPANQAAGLGLEDGASAPNLVGKPSKLFPDRTLVVPGDPASSYLMVVLGSRQGPLPQAGTMPFNAPLLCDEMRAAIERWIASGAGDG